MNPADWQRRGQQALVVIAIVLVTGALQVAKAAVVPVLFAVFLAMLLSPAVSALHRLRLPRAIAAAIVIATLITVLGLTLNAIWKPARDWLDAAPATMHTLEVKLRPITHLRAKVESVSKQAGHVTDPVAIGDSEAPPVAAADQPSTVENTREWLVAVTTTLMVTYFLLVGGKSLLIRLDAAFGARRAYPGLLQIVTQIHADVVGYFAAVTVSSLLLGIGTAATMQWLEMPSPLMWGVVAFLLNYVPYAGPATTLTLLTVVAAVSFDGLGKAFAVASCFLVLTGVEGQILQPVLVGRRLDVSPLVVLLSLWFGGWLWGIAGVALAVPLLVSIKSSVIEWQGLQPQGQSPSEAAPPPPRRAATLRSRAAQFFAGARRPHRKGSLR